MSWRNQGITGSNNIPLGKTRRFGGEPELDGPDRDLKRGRDPEPRLDDGPRRRKKRNRWGDASENKAAGLMGLPTAIKANMTSEQLEAYTLHLRIEEISQKLRIDDVVPADGDRSPSPPPQYDNHGRRVNTREYRYRKRLEDERHKLVERAMKTIPNYHPPQDYRRPTKTQEKVYVPVNDYPEINFIGLLIGPRGNTLKKMEAESGAKIAIRGKGSVKEGKGRSDAAHSSNQEEDLHCLIMADTEDKINKAKQLIHNVIETVPEGQNDLKRNQLRELAALNGTLRDDENQACQNCGKIGHRKYDCPERQNFTASVICRVCGNAGHFARDCPDRQRGSGWRNDVGNGRPAGRIGGGDAVDREMEQLMQELGGGPSAAPAQIEAGPGGGHENGDVKPWQRSQGGGGAALGVPATKIRATVLRVVLAAAVPHLGPGTETAVTRLSRTATMARATALLQEQVHQEALRLGTSLLPRPQARLAATRAMADMVVPMVAPLCEPEGSLDLGRSYGLSAGQKEREGGGVFLDYLETTTDGRTYTARFSVWPTDDVQPIYVLRPRMRSMD
ncbi:hypothetical protein ACCO45_013393 [Purpureocillium lilacinum]|uniref:Uncharacterized protein n=1 Tax=Purpureocillium lilacinum TaxID=33203 RepID=A0ACC4D611_PURLI